MNCAGAAERVTDDVSNAQEISVKWNGFSVNMLGAVAALGAAGDALADVTLVAGGRTFPAHRLVLSANSALFRAIFEQTPARDAVVVLNEVTAECVSALLGFMYRGEVRVTEEFLPRLLRAADTLRVCGLSAAADRAHRDQPEPKVSPVPHAKKRKKENEETAKSIKKHKETQGNWEQQTLHNNTMVPKMEPMESTSSDSAGECTSDSDVLLSDVTKCSGEVSSTQSTPVPAHTTPVPAHATPDDPASIEKEIENVLQSGAIVESIGATVENSISATDNDKGGVAYSNPSFPCPFCPRVYNSWGYRRRHVKSRHHTNRLSCKWCVCELSSTGEWYGHATRAHGAAPAAARDSLVVLVEAHAVLTLHEPSPAALLRQLAPLNHSVDSP